MLYYAEMYEEALVYNQKTLRIKFDYLPAEKLMPKIYFENDNVEEAINYLNELNTRYPTDEDNRLYLAQIFELIKNYNSAIKTYNETLLINEKNIEAHMGLIRCFISENKINALLNELQIFTDTFTEDNKYQDIIDKLIEKYMPKLITDEKELEDIISKNE
jgi:tetratricopeptide (TPR) repeat protein